MIGRLNRPRVTEPGALFHDYCEAIYANRWRVLVFFGLVAAWALFQAAHLKSTMDNRVFFGPENPELLALNALESAYSQNNDVLVAVEPKDGVVFQRRVLEPVRDLTERLWKIPYVSRVDSLTNFQHSRGAENDIEIRDLVPEGFNFSAESIDRIKSIALGEAALRNLIVSPDGKMTGIRLNFAFPRENSESIVEITRALAALKDEFQTKHPDLRLYFTGNVMVMQAFGEAQERDILFLVPLMLPVMGIVLYFLLRSMKAAAVALGVSGLATIITMGIASALGIVMSAGSAPAPFIVLTVALAYNVHLISEFVDGCRQGASNRVAALNAVDCNAFAIFLTGLTTAIGFLSLNASDAPPFHDLGNISAIGVIVAFVTTFSLTPVLLLVVRVPVDRKTARVDMILRALAAAINRNPVRILTASFAIVFVLTAGIFHMKKSENWIAYFDQTFEFRRDTDVVLKKLSGFDVIELSVPAGRLGGIDSPEYMAKLDSFAVWLREQPEVLNVQTLSDIVKKVNRNIHSDLIAYEKIPESKEQVAQYLLLYEMSLPRGISLNDRITVSREASRVTIILGRDGRNLPSDELLPVADRIEGWLKENGGAGMAASATGLSLMFAHLSERNIEMMLGGTTIAILLVSIILIVGLRSFQLSAISLVGDCVPALMALGVWGHLVSEMNVAVSIVAALTFGIVVDDTIHYLTKYARARRVLGMTPEQAVEHGLATTGKAMIFTMTVMCCGFAVLSFSSFGVNETLGLLTVITFGFALVSDLFILAPLVLVCDRSLALFSWKRDRSPTRGGEFPLLRARVEAYNERMGDNHLFVGRAPSQGSVQLWSNDYLGLGGHPEIVQAQVERLQEKSEDVFMSAVFLNETSLQSGFERQMAAFLGTEAAVLCQSGWSANTGLIQALADSDTPVYIDQFAHASLWDGIRMAGAQVHAFRHNQPQHLERLVASYGPGLILVDSVYSAAGSVCPLAEICAIGEKLNCIIVVDESHSVGVYGPRGEGLVHTLGLTSKVHYLTFSLSKAFATRAGMVAGPKRVMSYFPYEARPAIFSSAVLQHEVAGLSATLKVIQEEEWRRAQLWANTRALRKGLRELGYSVDPIGSQIVALHAGNDAQTRALRDALEERGVFGAVFCSPATPKNHGIVRLSVNARLRDHDIQAILAAAKDIATNKCIAPWPAKLMVRESANENSERPQRDAGGLAGGLAPLPA
jgi:hypothetical protein